MIKDNIQSRRDFLKNLAKKFSLLLALLQFHMRFKHLRELNIPLLQDAMVYVQRLVQANAKAIVITVVQEVALTDAKAVVVTLA